MTRRALLLVSMAAAACADSADQVWDVVAALSSALSEGHAEEFLHTFDPGMPGYQRLHDAVTAAVRDYEIETTVDLVSNEGDDSARALVADWQFGFVLRGGSVAPIRRHDRITLKFQKQPKRWRIVSLDPASAFNPPPLA